MLKDTWLQSDKNTFTKNGFKITLLNDDVKVSFKDEVINKPFVDLTNAMYWCEARMFSTDNK